MRIPVSLAWALVLMTFFTAGLLRQFHDGTPQSPYVPPVVGSLLFAGILFLLLVSAREWRRGAVPGPGVRLGSITPLLLMLLIEKWISLALYNPIFYLVFGSGGNPEILDAQFRAFAGIGLLAVCSVIAFLSAPTARKTWRRARPSRWPLAALATLVVVAGTYGILGGLGWAFGASFTLAWPPVTPLLIWVLGGQAMLAFAEEVYYRGLLLSEVERLAPRLGVRTPTARRWTALGTTSVLFGMEHIRFSLAVGVMGRQLVFTMALGILFGLLVMVTANLHYSGGIHAWINWLLLGAAPHFVNGAGRPSMPAGIYIGVMLLIAFVLLGIIAPRWLLTMSSKCRRWGWRRRPADP